MTTEKERIEEGLRGEIEKCQNQITFINKNIEVNTNAINDWINQIKDLEYRIEMLQKFISTLDD